MKCRPRYLLYSALFIPFLMLMITIVMTIFHRVVLHPQYDFLYARVKTHEYSYPCEKVLKEKISNLNEIKGAVNPCQAYTFAVYHMQSHAHTIIPVDQIAALKMSVKIDSPDGFRIQSYCTPMTGLDWFSLLLSHVDNTPCLVKGKYQDKLFFEQGFRYIFLGWIL